MRPGPDARDSAAGAGAMCSHARMAIPSSPGHAGDMSMQEHTTSLDEAVRLARRAGPGSTVEVVDRAGRRMMYEIVAQLPGPAPRPVRLDSAEGLALLGARTGDALALPAENGRLRRVSVVDVTPAARSREDDPLPA
jgi:hypothetical protein